MADPLRRLILANGEVYIAAESKNNPGRATEPPRTYEEARARIRESLQKSLESLKALPREKRLPGEATFCLRLHPDATAKSYDPTAIFDEVPDLENVGSRNYQVAVEKVAATERTRKRVEAGASSLEGRMIFVRTSPQGFRRFFARMDVAESRVKEQFKREIRRIELIDLLAPSEQILGFTDDWKEGRVELVLHPSSSTPDRQMEFVFQLFDFCNIDQSRSRVRQYPYGPTFASCYLTRSMLNNLAGTNPLRSAHPLNFGGLEDLRSAPTFPAPAPPQGASRSTIKVGMFDGGIDASNPLLVGHAEEDTSLSITTTPDADGVAHGTAVAGVLLHGPLNGLDDKHVLPPPPVYVVSFRCLPTSDPTDVDLYEAIDVIEKAVPVRKDIKVFNLSFGPRGPILDDTLSRFTYMLDNLAVVHKVTFVTAVGNDGTINGYDRIQAPSDHVHGIGVGAYRLNGSQRVHAEYSCKGPGRECGKIKPDVAAFGGCADLPIHLVATIPGKKSLSAGTSFAAPQVARVAAQATECFDRATTLLGRALLVHTAVHPSETPDHLLGHGCVLGGVDDVLYCPGNAVTIAFLSDILPTKSVKLPIPLPRGVELPGKVTVTWTVAGLVPIDSRHPSDYTSCCIEDTFYPHSQVHNFTKVVDKRQKSKKLNPTIAVAEAAALKEDGWQQSSFPATASGNVYKDEHEKRSIDCKWEPIVRRTKTMLGKSLHEPFLVLHAIPRNRAASRFEYVALITIQAPKFAGDLYSEIRNSYPALAPIRLRTEAETRIRV